MRIALITLFILTAGFSGTAMATPELEERPVLRLCMTAYADPENIGAQAACERDKRALAEIGEARWCDPLLRQEEYKRTNYAVGCALRQEQMLPHIRQRMPSE